MWRGGGGPDPLGHPPKILKILFYENTPLVRG